MPLADGVNVPLAHTEATNADLGPGTSLEERSTGILSAWQSSDSASGVCLSAVVTDKNTAVKEDVNCSCCLRPRAKICLKARRAWEQPLSVHGFAPSHVCE